MTIFEFFQDLRHSLGKGSGDEIMGQAAVLAQFDERNDGGGANNSGAGPMKVDVLDASKVLESAAPTTTRRRSTPGSEGRRPSPQQHRPVELGTINYRNLSPSDGGFKHGDYGRALRAAAASSSGGKPLFVNFVEYPGCVGVWEAGKNIFSHTDLVQAVHEAFVPVYFNTWDRKKEKSSRSDDGDDEEDKSNSAFAAWGGELADSDWGYVRIVTPDGEKVVAGTGQITGGNASNLEQVVAVATVALEELGRPVPAALHRLALTLNSR